MAGGVKLFHIQCPQKAENDTSTRGFPLLPHFFFQCVLTLSWSTAMLAIPALRSRIVSGNDARLASLTIRKPFLLSFCILSMVYHLHSKLRAPKYVELGWRGKIHPLSGQPGVRRQAWVSALKSMLRGRVLTFGLRSIIRNTRFSS